MKLVSGKEKLTSFGNLPDSRYEFIKLEEVEPNLGVGSNNFVLVYRDGVFADTATSGGAGPTITLGSQGQLKNLSPGMIVSGTNIVPGTKITNINGTTVTLDASTTGAVSGTISFSALGRRAWANLNQIFGTGPQGVQGAIGPQGSKGDDGTSVRIIGSVPNVNVNPPNNPQTTLNAAFPGKITGDGVIDEATGDLWIYNGAAWVNVGNIQGPQGPQGVQGAAGSDGADGEDGADGPQGPQGPDGPEGPQGPPGAQGTEGASIEGPPGPQGFQGRQGAPGAQGDNGTSIEGPQGPQGFQGRQGAPGAQGTEGTSIEGPQGPQGVQGRQGATGAQGRQGVQGARGSDGIDGIDGTNGQDGPQGPQGFQGRQGAPGAQGAVGAQGVAGAQGAQGAVGAQGVGGAPSTAVGPQGAQGAPGAQGAAGAQGASGAELSGGSTDKVAIWASSSTLTFDNNIYRINSKLYAEDFIIPSDEKLKSNVVVLNDVLSNIQHVNGVTYNWNEKAKEIGYTDESLQLGLIAQEIAKVYPEAIEYSREGYMCVKYERLVAILFQAIKELNEKVNNHISSHK